MQALEIEIDQLSGRASDIRELLAPLRNGRPTIASNIWSQLYHGCKAIVAHDGVGNTESLDSCNFRTFSKDMRGRYHELWRPLENGRTLILHRAYLTILRFDREVHRFDKIVSVHCEPCEEGDSLKCVCKRSPHLHVQSAEHPIPRCHFPLNVSDLDRRFSSLNRVTEALSNAIEILCEELLKRYLT